jgi:predicted secreted protein
MNRRLVYPLVALAALIAIVGYRSRMASRAPVEPDPTGAASATGSASPPTSDSAPSPPSSTTAAVDDTDSGNAAGGDAPPARAESDAGTLAVGALAVTADGGHRVGTNDASAVTVDETNANTTVALGRGQKLVVQLKANPSTGFDWSVIKAPPALGKPEMGTVPGAGEGAPGLRRLTFTPKDPLPEGEHTVELGYARSFEEGKPPLKTFRFKVRSGG